MGSIGFWILDAGFFGTNFKSVIWNPKFAWACSSVWLERTPDKREVDGSTPSRPTIWIIVDNWRLNAVSNRQLNFQWTILSGKSYWGCSSAGRAPALHAGGHRFEPVHLHQKYKVSSDILFLVEMEESSIFVLWQFGYKYTLMFSMIVSIILWPSY